MILLWCGVGCLVEMMVVWYFLRLMGYFDDVISCFISVCISFGTGGCCYLAMDYSKTFSQSILPEFGNKFRVQRGSG